MLKILALLSLSGLDLLVSGNPLALIPIQTCPQNYNQNYAQNIQNPINIPVMVQSNPVQQIPHIIQQPSNNQLYPQAYTIQNQLATQTNTPLDPINQLNQFYMNKILSNPNIQTILDQANLYSQLGIEVPIQVNTIPNTIQTIPNNIQTIPNTIQTVPNTIQTVPNSQVPHVVNNYFILPPEVFESENIKLTNPRRQDKEVNRRHNNSNENRRVRHDSEENFPVEHRRKRVKNQTCEPKPLRENQRRPIASEFQYNTDDRDRNHRRRNQDERKVHSERVRERNIPLDEHHINGRGQHQERDRHINRSQDRERSHKQSGPKPEMVMRMKERPQHASHEKSLEKVERPKKNNRKSRDDVVVEDFQRKFPAIPEEVVRKLLAYLRNQLQKQQTGQSFHYPNMNFPLRYDQIFAHMNNNQRGHNIINQNKKPKAKITPKPNKLVETTTNPGPTVVPTTTEASKSNKPTKVHQHKTPQKEQVKTTTNIPKDIEQETTTFPIPELGTEDVVLDVNNGVIEDYYPDFTKDKIYESGENFSVRNLRDNRYYYTTDRNFETTPSTHEYYMKKLKDIHKKLDEHVEEVIVRPDIDNLSDMLEYRTPPLLESPDFKTKQIIKQKPKPDYMNEIEKDISYKSSTYSDAKTPPSKDIKTYKINGNSKKIKPDSIETVYAHSKVVKYGKTNEESGEQNPVVTYYLPDNMQYEEDGKTVIIAKSIPADQFW